MAEKGRSSLSESGSDDEEIRAMKQAIADRKRAKKAHVVSAGSASSAASSDTMSTALPDIGAMSVADDDDKTKGGKSDAAKASKLARERARKDRKRMAAAAVHVSVF